MRYEKKGALQLFASLGVVHGQVYCQERNEVSPTEALRGLQAFLPEVIIPETLRRGTEVLVLIVNNGPTHTPKQMERWLAAQVRTHG